MPIVLAFIHALVASWTDFPDWRTYPPGCNASGCWSTMPPADDSHLVDLHRLPRDSLDSLSISRHRILEALLWPIDKSVPVMMEIGLKPLKMPVVYAESSDVVDRGVGLVTFSNGVKGMLYPTMVMDGGQGSRLGMTAIGSDLGAEGTYFRLSGSLMINRDWYGSFAGTSPTFGPLSSRLRGRVAASQSSNAGVWIPEASGLDVASSNGLVSMSRVGLDFGIPSVYGSNWMEWRWGASGTRTGQPAYQSGAIRNPDKYEWFDRGDRGLSGLEYTQAIGMTIGRGTQDLEGTPTRGGVLSLDLDRTFSQGGGDVWIGKVKATRYILLGTDKYVYRKGDLEFYRNFSPRTLLLVMDPDNLALRLSSRRILAFLFRASWMREVDESDPASFYNFPSLGGSPPARSYGGGRLVDLAVGGATVEYRWPIWKYIDGSLFLECAWAGPTPWEPDPDRIAPGTGLGVRVRTPSMFLFRTQMAYGLSGWRGLVTVDPEF